MRLSRAIEIAFPCGGMTVSGLRKEAAKGRLVIERIAGKDFVTLAAIAAMRAQCQRQARAQDSTFAPATASARRSGSSSTAAGESALASLQANVRKLRSGSPITSPRNTGQAASAA
jgi:hypothetical protein